MREVWRGNSAAWECDELGHLNVRAYLAKAMEAVASLGVSLGLIEAWSARAFATLRPSDIHIRYMKECRPGAPLAAFAGVLDVGEDWARVYVEIRRSASDDVAAALRLRLKHVAVRTGEAFAWRESARTALEAARIEAPAATAPKGLDPERAPRETVSLAEAQRLGLERIGMGVIDPAECGVFGWIRPETVLSRVSTSVVNFRTALPEETAQAAAGGSAKVGTALLEARLIYRGWPRAGAAYEIHSGLGGVEGRTRRLVHWMIDPVTGRAWASMEGVGLLMDLVARRAAPLDEALQAKLKAAAIEGLSL